MKEIFKDVVGYEKMYQVSNLGNVKSLEKTSIYKTSKGTTIKRKVRGKHLKQCIDRYGYSRLCLCKDGHERTLVTHRLVAQAFIPNPENKQQVNHINGIKTDNRLENLEWVTASENSKHRFDTLGHKGNKSGHEIPIRVNGIVFESLKAASLYNKKHKDYFSYILKKIKQNEQHYPQWDIEMIEKEL